jgi:hypothetical protein
MHYVYLVLAIIYFLMAYNVVQTMALKWTDTDPLLYIAAGAAYGYAAYTHWH